MKYRSTLIGGAIIAAVVVGYDFETQWKAAKYAPAAEAEALQFKGYRCTQDCSGHIAGYSWAERKGITNPDKCAGNSESFIEGCRAYAEGRR